MIVSIRSKVRSKIRQCFGPSEMLIGLLFAAGAALGFSAKAIFIKLAYNYDVDAITLLMMRMMFALPFFVVMAFIEERKTEQRIDRVHTMLIVLLGLLGYYLSSLLDFMGLVYVTAGLERLILFVYPTMVVILSALFFGKTIRKEAVIALILSYAGIAFAMVHDLSLSGEHVLLGAGFVFASTLTYSLFLVGSGEVIPKVGAKRFTAYAMIVSSLAVFAQFFAVRDMGFIQQPVEVYGYAMAMALFSTVLPSFLLAAAIARMGASITSITGSLGPVATLGMAAVFLGEPMSMAQLAGAALVLTGIFILGKQKED